MAQPPPPPRPGPGAMARPAPITTAAVMLLVVGGFRALIGLIALTLLGRLLDAGGIGIIAIVELLVVLVAAALQIMGGVNVLRLRQTGYRFGLFGTALAIVARIVDFIVVASLGYGGAGGFALGIPLLLADIVIIVLLVQNREALTG